MYGNEAESTIPASNATVTVNDIVVTLPESVPYDEPPTWRTKVTLTTNHSDWSKTDDIYRNIISLFRGESITANLVQLWKELKKQYNAVLQKLLTREESLQIVLEMFMFSQRGHESFKREISDGRFSRVLLLLFEDMTEGKVDSVETSFDVKQEIDRFTETTPPSPTSTLRSFGEQSIDSLASFSESIALGGFSGDPYGSVQEFSVGLEDTPVDSLPLPPLVNIDRRQLTGADQVQTNTTIPETVGPLPLSTRQVHKIRIQLDSSVTRQLGDVRNTQEKDKMEIFRRIEKLEKITKQSHATTEIMQASQKAAVDEGFSKTRGNLQDLSEKMDDMERLFEEKIQGIPQARISQESEKIHDLSHEVKDFRREFDRFRGETMEKLDSVEKSMFDAKHSIEKSVSDIKETLMEISKSLPTSPISSLRKSDSHVHLSSHHHTHDQSFTLPDTCITVAKMWEDSDSSSSRKSSEKLVQREDEKVNSIHQPRTIKLSDVKDIQSETQLENRDEQLPSMSIERSDQTLHTESLRVPILSPELEAALQHAEHEGLLSDLESESGYSAREFSSSSPRPTVEGATGFSNEHMHGSGHTLPFQPMSLVDTSTDQDEQAILAETQRTLQTDAEIVFEANECRKTSGLPLTVDVLKVLSKALQESKDIISLPETADGGIDTILCIDLSASVEGKAFEQLKSVLIEFLTEAEDLSVRRNLLENIAIVVLGLKTEIMFPLNVDYSDMLDQICNLRTGGTSPLHTAMVLCRIALREKGGPLLIGRYIIPARIVIFSDGRPTDDSQMHDLMSEHREKPSEIGERVKAMAHQLHYQGYTLFTVPIGTHVNRVLLKDIASFGGGKMINLEDFGFIKKYFNYQAIASRVIEICHNTGNQSSYPEFIQGEVNQVNSGLDQDDIIHITEIIHTSQELDDKEHTNLPSLGSRVQILSGEATSQSLPFGTVIQNLNDGWIKVQLDSGLIDFYHYSNSDQEVVKVVTSPCQLRKDQLIDCGISVCDLENPDKKGVVFRVTVSGYVDVRWENGTKSRHKYGADGVFDLQIHNESRYDTVFYQWQYFESQQWINFDTTSNSKIEESFQKKDKTCLVDMDRARILFDRKHMKYIEKEIIIPVRRSVEYR